MVNWKTAFSRVRSALMRRGRAEHDAEDLVQEAWLRLASYAIDQTVAEPEAFLMRTALNLSADAYRSDKVRGEAMVFDEESLVDSAPSVEDVLLGHERMTRFVECLDLLDPKTSAIFLAHRVSGLTYPEIAQQEQLSVSAVEKHIARAMLILTRLMEGW